MNKTNTPAALTQEPVIGSRYNWLGQPERLVFMGSKRYPGDGRKWYQFAKVDVPGEVWSEVLKSDLPSFEETKDGCATPQPAASVASGAIPHGFVLVPFSPTDEMLRAGRLWDNHRVGSYRDREHAEESYKRLLAATAQLQPRTPAEPSDADLAILWGFCNIPTDENDHTTGPAPFARQVLARWGAAQPRTLDAPVSDAAQLRRLLCLVYSRGMAYLDDGEMSDSQRNPAIDFLRDEPAEIERKINARNADTLTPPSQKVLIEHSGCGSGTQYDSINVKLNPGDKVVLHKGRMTQGFECAEMAMKSGEQAS